MTRYILLLVVVAVSGCATVREPVLPALSDAPEKTPVVLIPGITGTKLRDRETGRLLWGHTAGFFLPRDGGYALAVSPGDGDEPSRGAAEPFAAIMEVRIFGLWKVEAYGSLVRLMEKNGYKHGDLRDPKPGENFFIYLYDWRKDNVQTARELARQLERLRTARGGGPLTVTLVCQSNAAHIGRYFLKYGSASLDEAESGLAGPPSSISVDKLMLVGSSNGGAIRVLHEMNHGRNYVPLIGRRWLPETLFTFASLYQDLPVYRQDLFFGVDGQTIEVDLFDDANWQRYGWSIYDGRAQARVRLAGREKLFGNASEQAEFLSRALENARRFHQLLARDVEGFGATQYYSLQNLYTPTPERAMLVEENGRWRTLFQRAARVRGNPYLLSLASSPGDEHATLDSQQCLSPQEKTALARPPVYMKGGHFEIILSPAAQQRILEFLTE